MLRSTLIFAGLYAGLAAPLGAEQAGDAEAETLCASRDAIIARLNEAYGEVHRAGGLDNAAKLVEIWTSDATGTWTILITEPSGQSCIAATGSHWQDIIPSLPVKG